MMNTRLPKVCFVLTGLYAAVRFSFYYPKLPATVASHFDGRGTANGWQSKDAFFVVFAGVSLLAALLGFGIPRLIEAMPMRLINLPNKEYWLAGEQRTASLTFLKAHFAWFGCALLLVIVFAFNYAVQSNLHPERAPDVAGLWFVLAGFAVFMIVSTIRLFQRFGRPPSKILSS